jgi:hypothetical protein
MIFAQNIMANSKNFNSNNNALKQEGHCCW